MSFDTIAGQEQAKRFLRNGLRNNKLSHAYIFSGPSGSGRKRMAAKLAQAVYCLEREDDACGQCIECRKVEHGNHPDFYWVEPDGASIKIEQIRELQKGFSYKSTDSKRKIYVLNEADKMTVQAANSLLKFLEEPQSDIMAILITENAHALLPTIQSRAQGIPFVPMDPKVMAARLQEDGLSVTLVLPAVQLAAGMKAARELVEAPWFAEARNVVVQLARETLTRFPAALLTVQQKVIKTDLAERVPALLDLWILWFKDMIHLQVGNQDNVVYIDQRDELARLALSKEAKFWVGGIEKIVEAQKRLRFHANAQLALEKLLIDIQGG
ncbi:DNA polymerase III subunit delta' [Paenibacillus aurantius]|uniref:DNA polymerase III subunit delta' n=1 Tax=Paenibacillus aurantius TaxID=2918900 RepID=A0AA96RFV3_9BACL|nr:DNA polymerase III subunit delta' [Paenibacillus aurantius]WNQ11653.1 DNA polymerase III subunit delta' [Paenibacillus aurantius]